MTGLGELVVVAILVVPLVAAAILAVVPGYRPGAAINVVASLLTFVASLGLFHDAPAPGLFLMVDDPLGSSCISMLPAG